MITRHHLVLILLCGLIIGSVTAGTDPFILVVLIGGAAIGAILPDIHMKRPKKTRALTIAWYVVQIGRWICIPIMSRIYRICGIVDIDTDDKCLTHSVPGMVIYSGVFAGIMLPLAFLSGKSILPEVFLGGIILGFFLHLTEDLCTKKGIPVFYPFTECMIHGSIRPCDMHDKRIRRFQVQHVCILGIVLLLHAAAIPAGILIACGFAGIGIGIVAMIGQSDVRMTHPEKWFSKYRKGVST
jgi:membrane-bound metal-dependent hydrolase YbcI (DUF457 family)